MLNKVEVRTAAGTLLSLPFEDPSSGFAVRDIQGIDPVKATIVSSTFAQLDGTQYHSSRREARNITMKIGLYPDYVTTQVRDLRLKIYDYLLPKSLVSLRFYDDSGLTVNIMGRVEICEAAIFAKEPVSNISIMCFDVDFIDLNDTTITGSTVSDTTQTVIAYPGSTETGIVFTLNVNRTLTQFTIYHVPPDGTLRQLDFAAALIAGDVVTINTKVGSKSATLTRGGSTSSLLYGVSPQANWTSLQKGNNNLRVYAVGAAIPYSLTYTARYGGL